MPKRAKTEADAPVEAVIEQLTTVSGAPSSDPRALEKALGLRIRQLRRQQDLSVVDLAAAAGLSTGMLSKIENGQISASLTSIHSLAQALSAPISSLFALAEERQDCSFVAAGEGVKIDRRGTKSGHVYQLLGHLMRGDLVIEPYLITLSDGASPYTSFSHAGTELIHMLEGTLSYRHGDRRYDLAPGDTLLFDSQAQQILSVTDAIAERVRKNDADTLTSIGAIASTTQIADQDSTSLDADKMVKELRDDNAKLVARLKEVKDAAEEAGDNATSGIVDEWTDFAEERVWFLREILR